MEWGDTASIINGQANIQMRRDRRIYFEPLAIGVTGYRAAISSGPQIAAREVNMPRPLGVGQAAPARVTLTGLPANGGVTFNGSDPTQPKLSIESNVTAPEGEYPLVYTAYGTNDSEATTPVTLVVQ